MCTLLLVETAGDCLPSAVSHVMEAAVSSSRQWQGKEEEPGFRAGGHSPALGEQGLKGARLSEQLPAQLYCLPPYLFSRSQSNVNVTCAPRAKLPFAASAARKADKPEHLRLQSPLLHKRQGQTEKHVFRICKSE